MGSRWLSLVGTAQGPAAQLDALDSQALPDKPGVGAATAGDECAADGSAAAKQEKGTEAEDLRSNQTWGAAETPHSREDRQLGCPGPGFAEIDLVSHSGNSAEGEFAHTLNLTDIYSGWTESQAVLGKSEIAVQQALDAIQAGLPFRLLGLDSDNGSEFINWHLKRWCDQKQIQLTRGRPYKKNDNAHIEQKNWTHVRKLLGWDRYDSAAAVAAINAVYRQELRLWMNLYLPSVKLKKKVRVGSKLRRVYGPAQTPLERLLESGQADKRRVAGFKRLLATLDPFDLATRINRKLEGVYQLANRRLSPNPETVRRPSAVEKTRAGKVQKPDFSTPLGNPAKNAGFPLSHSSTTAAIRLHS